MATSYCGIDQRRCTWLASTERSGRIGLQAAHFANVLFEEFKEPTFAPPPLLKRMVTAGRLGRKVGRGFYDYEG